MAPYSGWIFPVEMCPIKNDGRRAVISDGFKAVAKDGARQHLGVDLMYPNATAQTPKPRVLTKWFAMPDGCNALAAGPGKVWTVGADSHGTYVEIDHGNVPGAGPRMTVYRHLARASVVKGDVVAAGHPVGVISFDPVGNGPSHLHFELWDTSRPKVPDGRRESWSVDPAPFMGSWSHRGRDGSMERGDGGPMLVAESTETPGDADRPGGSGVTGADQGAELAALGDLTIVTPLG